MPAAIMESSRPRREGPPQCYRPPKKDPLPNDGSMTVTAFQQVKETYLNFNAYRTDSHRYFCDVVIFVNKWTFYCHRVVLAASSPYFGAMFLSNMSEAKQHEICLNNLDGAMLSLIIDFIYTAEITVNTDNIQSLMETAVQLQMPHVIEACTTFLENELHPSNCIGIKRFAAQYGQKDLKNRVDTFIRRRFCDVFLEEEFLGLDHDELEALISNEKLTVLCETQVYEASMRWIAHDIKERKIHLPKLLESMRLVNMDPKFIYDQLCHCNVLPQMPPECVNKLTNMLQKLSTHSAPNQCPRKPCDNLVLYTVGGFRTDSPIRDDLPCVEYYHPVDKQWVPVADLRHPRSGAAVSALEGCLYVVGGRTLHQGQRQMVDVNMVECYNPKHDAWSDGPAMTNARNRAAIAVLDNKLYVCGGAQLINTLKTVECFDPKTRMWTGVAEMNTPRMAAGCGVINRFLYVVGGTMGRHRTNTMEKYHPEENRWEKCPPMSIPRSGAGVCATDKYLYVAGGFDGAQQLSSVERYNTETNQWSQVAPLKTPRSAANLISVDNHLFICGGCAPSLRFVYDIDRYDPETDEWTNYGQMPPGRSGQGVALGSVGVKSEPMEAAPMSPS